MIRTALLVLMVLVLGPGVVAHEIRPALLELTELETGRFQVLWKIPVLGGVSLVGEDLIHTEPEAPEEGEILTLGCGCSFPRSAMERGVPPIHPHFPDDVVTDYASAAPTQQHLSGARIKRWVITTAGRGLVGSEIEIHGLEATMLDVLVRIHYRGGELFTGLLRPDSPALIVPAADNAGAAVATYLSLGVEHILLGIDHLLFVLCLLLLVRNRRSLLATITAFTLSHSVTLGLAALGMVHIPIAPVEAVIALSIVFLAVEVAKVQAGGDSVTARRPWLVALTFGLLHGFGFAGALSQVGLPTGDIPLALLLFNLGIELGQLLFIGTVLLVIALSKRISGGVPQRMEQVVVYSVGTVSAYWLIARFASMV